MKLEIFKVGKHTSSDGTTKEYSLEDLNSIIANHSEPTPIVVGHPQTNSPAFGWIKNLFIQGESLFAEATDLVPEFLDLVKQKIYKNRSVSLKQNEDGTLSLNHVGFLGGALPAVKGLQELNLNADDSASFEFSLAIELDEETEETTTVPVAPVVPTEPENLKAEFESLKSDVAKILEFMGSFPVQNSQPLEAELQAKIDELNLKIDLAYFQKNMTDKLQMADLTPAIKSKILIILGNFQSLEFSQEQQTKIISDFQELVDLIQPFQTDEILKKVEFTQNKKNSNAFDAFNVDKESLQLFNEASQLSEEEAISFSEAIHVLINKNNSEV